MSSIDALGVIDVRVAPRPVPAPARSNEPASASPSRHHSRAASPTRP